MPSASGAQEELEVNTSSGLPEEGRKIIANVNTDSMAVNEVNGANISSSRTVEVYEGQDVMLTFVVESYPPIRNQYWMPPRNINNTKNKTVYEENYSAAGSRLAC